MTFCLCFARGAAAGSFAGFEQQLDRLEAEAGIRQQLQVVHSAQRVRKELSLKGADKPKKLAKKQPQKTLKQKRSEKRAAAKKFGA